jgi:Holliday junction resolvase RusA-like endonuclease
MLVEPFPWDEEVSVVVAVAGVVLPPPSMFDLVFEARPVPQGRPRAFQKGGRVIVTKAEASRAYERSLANAARSRAIEIGWRLPAADARLELHCDIYRAADQGDLTNFLKAIEDALTEGGVWLDDRRVVRLAAAMFVDPERPRVELQVRALP